MKWCVLLVGKAWVHLIQMNHLALWFWFGMTIQLAEIVNLSSDLNAVMRNRCELRFANVAKCHSNHFFFGLSQLTNKYTWLPRGFAHFQALYPQFPRLFRSLPLFTNFHLHSCPIIRLLRWLRADQFGYTQPTIEQLSVTSADRIQRDGVSSVDYHIYCNLWDTGRVILWILRRTTKWIAHEKHFTLRLHYLVILHTRDIDWKRRNRLQIHPSLSVIFGRADIECHQVTNLQMQSNIYLTSAVTLARVRWDRRDVICGSTPAGFLTRWDVWLKGVDAKVGE